MARVGNKAKSQMLKDLHLPDLLIPEEKQDTLWTASKVIATIGPASQNVDTLVKLLEAGVTCCRVDLTWGPVEYHRKSLELLQEASKRARKLCAVMVDTLGREVMVVKQIELDERGWPQHGADTRVTAGSEVVFTTRSFDDAPDGAFPVNFSGFTDMVHEGDTIFLGRYLVTGADESSLFLTVTGVSGTEVYCTANNDATLGGLLTVFHTERSSDSLTNVQNSLPVLSQQDKDAIASLAESFEIDFLSVSYARDGEDILEARAFLDSLGMQSTKLIAKLEARPALFSFKSIASAADGIILSRGNLGLDVPPEKMALVQKAVISNCNIMGKPVIITRLVDTMGNNPRPTRAEATDVANAVMDGADAFMLGAETLRGLFPVLTVETILRIARQAESVFDHDVHFDHLMQETVTAGAAEANGGRSLEHAMSEVDLGFANDALPVSGSPGGSMRGTKSRGLGSMANLPSSASLAHRAVAAREGASKMEAIASSAVRAADKVGASLIVVYTQSGSTASMVARYRPPMPILTLVVPQLKSDGLSWHLTGRGVARQCLIERGLLPVLAAPSPSGETLLADAIHMTAQWGLVRPQDHVVVIQMLHDSLTIKIVSVDEYGRGIASIQPQSLKDMIEMWQDKAGANADGGPVAATTIGESAGNALTPGAVSAVPALAPNGGGGDGAAGGNNGPPASEAPAAAPPSAGAQMKRWAFVTGGRSLSMLRPSGVVPK